jgi:hypothetical protein
MKTKGGLTWPFVPGEFWVPLENLRRRMKLVFEPDSGVIARV